MRTTTLPFLALSACTLLPIGQHSQPTPQPAAAEPTSVTNADGTTTVKAPAKHSGSQRALHPEIDDAVRGYAVEQTLTGDIKRFTPIALDASADRCYTLVVRLDDDGEFDGGQRIMARWGTGKAKDSDDTGFAVRLDVHGAVDSIAPLGCLLGAKHLQLRVEGAAKRNDFGHGTYTATLYARAGSADDRSHELADRKAAKQRAHDDQVARDKHWDRVEASQHANGCQDCREAENRCFAGDPPNDWKTLGWTCKHGYENCLGNVDLTPAACAH
ncbi:MAG TPA: hypothetical protein VMJ10_01695 [Kofleriaceae bacterium]|nr:hypothetical protein [Kofleriaceae bacterium]